MTGHDRYDRLAEWAVPLVAGFLFVAMMGGILLLAIHMSGCTVERGVVLSEIHAAGETRCSPIPNP